HTAVPSSAIFVGIVSVAQAATDARSQTQRAPGTPVTSVRWQSPPTQVSVVHGSPSGHSRAQVAGQGTIGSWVHPLAGLHPSLVHGSPSSQASVVPARQTIAPVSHASAPLHTLASSHSASV